MVAGRRRGKEERFGEGGRRNRGGGGRSGTAAEEGDYMWLHAGEMGLPRKKKSKHTKRRGS